MNFKGFKYRLLPRTLFGRSLMIVALPILLLQMIVAFVFFDRHWDAMGDKLVFALSGEVRFLSEQLAAAKTPEQVRKIAAQAEKSVDLAVKVEEAKTLPPAAPFEKFYWFSIGKKLTSALSRKLDKPFAVLPYESDRWFEIVVKIDGGRIARFLCPERRLTGPTTYIFILWLIGSAAILFGIAMAFMRNQIRPIMRLAIAAEKLGKGQDVPDFKPVGAAEVRQASRAFLDMKDRLKRQIEQRTAMLSGVSHDLRTPLTRMRLQLAVSRKSDAEIDNLRQDIDEMERMIEGYLAFARGEGDEAPEMTDLAPILDRIILKARRQGASVQDTVSGKLMLRVRPVAIERAIENVISNANKYAKNAWVSAYAQGDSVEIVVDDDGPGIAPHLREEVFKPFFRAEKSRNKETGGLGLGLSIAQDVVHAHGGEIFLEDSNRGGLRVVIRLPM